MVDKVIRTYYDLDTRQWSANAITKVEVTLNDKGKEVLHKKVVVMFGGMSRHEGDAHAEWFKNILNKSINANGKFQGKILNEQGRKWKIYRNFLPYRKVILR